MYHGVDALEDDPFRLFVSPERFAAQMRTLAILGLRGVSLAELCDARSRGTDRGLIGLTFDDGYAGVLAFAAPVLRRHGFGATLYAVSGLAGRENVWDPPPRRRLLTDAELRALQDQGWEIGSHSVTHARLTELDAQELRAEVHDSRIALREATGVVPRTFCYPFGAVDEAAVEAVRAAGYSYACAVQHEPQLDQTTWAIPRVGVLHSDRGPRFAAKVVLRGR